MIDIDNMSTRDVVRAVEGLGRRRDEEDTRAREAIAARDEARKECDALNRACANRERVIVALAKVVKDGAGLLTIAESALDDAEDFLLATSAGHPDAPVSAIQDALGNILGADVVMLAALTDPLVSECVADAEARQDARRHYP